ncbi:hypothetical protein QYE76_058428 [Lolium multiflorum]|uniref:Uncharacterized protein n=1 Tax=Lolium multiflorum TaxID=4521 RepID=A0AAD8WPP1_LOLMU|nr:hypothetical protein QYE76_058428 [Lolium multiflorum]
MENYSLLMGDSSVDEDGGGVDGEAFRALPRPGGVPEQRLLSPRSWLRDGGGWKLAALLILPLLPSSAIVAPPPQFQPSPDLAMVKKRSTTAAASSTSEGAAAKSSSSLPKGNAPNAPPPAPAPPAPSGSMAKPGDWILVPSENTHDSPDDTSEGKGSSIPVDFHTMDQTDGSVRNVDADRDTFVDAAADGAKASPAKRSTGGFADEDDLFDIDEGFVEPPPKKAKSDAVSPVVVASEASAPKAAPTAQASTASSLSKGKDISPTAATAAPFSDLRGVISSLEIFASRFTSLEADKVRLQKEVESSSSKLDGAVKIAAAARQEIDSLKEELARLKGKLKEEEASRLVAEARAAEKDEVLRQSSLALLEAANIPVDALERVANNSPSNAVSMVLASHQLTQELLVKGKSVLEIHSMIFPKINQEKTLGQLIDTFAVDTKEAIEVFKRTSRTFGAVLAFQLMMGYGFKGDIEEMTKGLPKGQDGH